MATETIEAYSKHITTFDSWCKSEKILSNTLTEKDLYDFIVHMNNNLSYSDNTKRLCIAALKFKLNKCERRSFIFPKQRKKAK